MAEKQIAKLGSFPRGMMPAMNRSEIPPDGLFYAENVDLRTPGRVRSVPQDAMLADGVTPDHVQRAADADFLDWNWLLNGSDWALTDYHTLFPASFAGNVYMVAANYVAQTVKVQAVGSGGAWTTLTSVPTSVLTTNRARPIYATGKNLLIPLVNGSDITYAACWDPSIDTAGGLIEVGANGYIQVDLEWDAESASVSKVSVLCLDTGQYLKLTCMESHTSGTVVGAEDYIGYDQLASDQLIKEENAYDDQVGWRRYWRLDGYQDYGGGAPGGYPAWVAATVYTGVQVTLKIKQTTTVIDTETPGTLPLEYFGENTGDDGDSYYGINADSLAVVPLPNMTNDDGWIAQYGDPPDAVGDFPLSPLLLRTKDLKILFRPIVSDVPEESEETQGVPRVEAPRSLLLQPDQWDGIESVTYYAVHEMDFGGWSRPKKLSTQKIRGGNDVDFAVGIQVFGWLADDYWGEGTRRVHFFRVENLEGGGLGHETWLFAVDRKDTQWIKGYGLGTSYMALTGHISIASEQTYTASSQGKINYEGACGIKDHPNFGTAYEARHSATTRAFMQAADDGYAISPNMKAGAGLYTFVDYGQPVAGESPQSIIGARISDLLGASAIDPSALTLIDTALGRAFYTTDTSGVVYYSEIDKYGIVDPTNFLTFEDSGSLIAAHSLHHYLLLLFQYKTVILDVRSGMDAGWSLVAEANGAGCLNRDCVARHEGQIFWMGAGAIWMWDGSGAPRRISEPIEYDAFVTDMNDADPPGGVRYAWLAVDPKSKDLIAHLGRANAADYSGWGQLYFDDGNVNPEKGKGLVYNIPTGAWSTELMRGFVATGDDGYGLLGKPFVLDNYLLIPCAKSGVTVYNAMLVRRSYAEFLGPGASASHINTIPIWKRAVLETGFLSLAGVEREFKLDRLHAVFTGDSTGGQRAALGISDAVLDHWKLYAYIIQDWEDVFPVEWATLGDQTPDYSWDVAAEGEDGDVGYHRSYYRKPLPRRQTRSVALRLVSQSDDDEAIVYETLVSKVELAALGLSFRPKARF